VVALDEVVLALKMHFSSSFGLMVALFYEYVSGNRKK